MSMQPQSVAGGAGLTAQVARAAFRKGSLAMRARDELGAWYEDEAFSAVYGTGARRGSPRRSWRW